MDLPLLVFLASLSTSPACVDYELVKSSPAIGAGVEIPGLTCPAPGHPGDGICLEWFNRPGPDIGACQAVYLGESIIIGVLP